VVGLNKISLVILSAAFGLLLLAGCSGGSDTPPPATPAAQEGSSTTTAPAAAPSHQLIVITEKGFAPATVTVKVGSDVIWSNSGKKSHSVVLGPGAESGKIKPGGTATHVFDEAGTFKYEDGLNPSLKGVVIVE